MSPMFSGRLKSNPLGSHRDANRARRKNKTPAMIASARAKPFSALQDATVTTAKLIRAMFILSVRRYRHESFVKRRTVRITTNNQLQRIT
jgi:hypothetical protein